VDGSVAALAEHTPRLGPEQERMAEAALSRIRAARRAPPTVKELAAGLGVRAETLLPVLKFLAERGELVAVTADLYYDAGALREIRAQVKEVLGGGRAAAPSELREALGVSRKYLIPLLEHLDAVGFTRRTGEGRVLREGP
jgi:selenocysteine-specific elongation factor